MIFDSIGVVILPVEMECIVKFPRLSLAKFAPFSDHGFMYPVFGLINHNLVLSGEFSV